MHAFKQHSSRTPGRLTILAVAIASALTAGQVNIAYAGPSSVSLLDNPKGTTVDGIQNTNTNSGNTLNNSGTINGITSTDNDFGNSQVGINNQGNIYKLSNSGTINGTTTISSNNNYGRFGIYNQGSIGTLSNSGTIVGTVGTISSNNDYESESVGIYNQGSIGTLSNSGTISGTTSSSSNNYGSYYGLYNQGSIGTLSNSGTIKGGIVGVFNTYYSSNVVGHNSSIGTLNNSGTISGVYGVLNEGTIGALNNSGTITGTNAAIFNIPDNLPNNLSSNLGTVTNSGTIAGPIWNYSTQNLTINGGSGSTFGLLTGSLLDTKTKSYGVGANNIGQISNSSSNLIFASGNQLLNDTINVGTFTVSNTGSTLQVNNSIAITGNYNQGANASLILGVGSNPVTTTGVAGSKDGYGRLVVSGIANVAKGSSIDLKTLGTYGFAQGQRYVVIQALTTTAPIIIPPQNTDVVSTQSLIVSTKPSVTNYNASTLHYTAAGYNVAGSSVVDNKAGTTDLLLTLGSAIPVITPVTPTPPSTGPINRATTTDEHATLAGLFNYGGYNAGLMNLFNVAAALDSSAAGNHAGAQLSPTSNLTAATQASTASTVQVLDVTAAHMDVLRTAQNGNNGSGVATGESASSTGLWGQGFGGSSRLGERDDMAGYHAHYSGLLLGADAALNDSWRAGGLFSYTDTTVNNDGSNAGSSADVKSYGLFGYATYTGSPWYVDLSLGAVQHQYDTTREVDFPGFSGTAKGQHDGMQYIGSVLAGYPIDLGSAMANTVLTPIAGLTYSTLRQDSYTEKDGGGAALHVSADTIGSLKSDLGAKLERSFGTPYGRVMPSAQLTWRHEYRDNGLQSVANYAADTSGATSFTTTGAKAIADTGVMTLGVKLMQSQNLSIGARYTLEAASGYAANTGDVQVRWDF